MYIYFLNSGIGTIEIDPNVEIRVVQPKMTRNWSGSTYWQQMQHVCW